MGKEPAVIEPGKINIEVPVDRNKTDDGHTADIVRIVLLNDDETLCSFVVLVLLEIDFNLTKQEADKIMWFAHFHGEAIVGYYPRDIAVKLLQDVVAFNARCGQYPRFIMQ